MGTFKIRSIMVINCSYRLLLWELFCVKIPFEEMDPLHLAANVLHKARPEIPSTCPLSLSGLMTRLTCAPLTLFTNWVDYYRCWDEDPQARPTFQEVIKDLRNLMEGNI